MELGAWSIISETPSLLGLIPMGLYIILAFKKGLHPIVPVIISISVGLILCGLGADDFGSMIGNALSSALGQVGLLIMLGAGLGCVMNETGVSKTLCDLIVRNLGVKSQKQAIIVIMICEFILATCIGSMTSAAAIVVPILLPLIVSVALTPITVGFVVISSGLAGMLLAPFSVPNIMAMELTGLSYPTYLLYGAAPYLILLLITGYVFGLVIQKKSTNKNEQYSLSILESDKSNEMGDDIRKQQMITTVAFLIAFVFLIIYAIITKQGLQFTIFVMCALSLVVIVFGNLKISDGINIFIGGCAKTVDIFIICVLYECLIVVINIAGGFDALSEIFMGNAIGNSKSSVMIFGTILGSFGINGGASAQMAIIHNLFLPLIKQTGLSMRSWSIVLIAGSYITSVIYPSVTIIAPMGICRTKDMKTMLLAMWVSSGIILAFVIIYSLIVPSILS